MMSRESLERHQVWIYLAVIGLGLALGLLFPALAGLPDWVLWPVLGLLLFATFTQVPMEHLGRAFVDARFTSTLLIGNFLLVPALVWLLVQFLPDDPVIRLGVAAVLLVPCTDWFISFTHLGRGDTARAIAVSPLLLFAQILLLPLYLVVLFDGTIFASGLDAGRLVGVFVGLILVPLGLAALLEHWVEARPKRRSVIARLGWLPVPLLALVVFLIAASQVQVVVQWFPAMGTVTAVFVAYLVITALAGRWLATRAGLGIPASRTLVFSLGTRNSFVVLPLALALPAGWEAAVVVIVLQSLVELLGMALYLRWVPARLLPDKP
ncbi:arsenic resistance protein [Thioalkalivibrio sulfidiphilus]|uniref:arsenic resistance protein n=1 Tax=Thioalkalivibrio sulfidiphilus TaxID=1033854 RepID=UPI0003608BAC